MTTKKEVFRFHTSYKCLFSLLIIAIAIILKFDWLSQLSHLTHNQNALYTKNMLLRIENAMTMNNTQHLLLSQKLTLQILNTLQKSDLTDKNIDISLLIFNSICCQTSLFRTKIWEKYAVYLPLSINPLYTQQLLQQSFPTTHDIQDIISFFNSHAIFESHSNFFINDVIRSYTEMHDSNYHSKRIDQNSMAMNYAKNNGTLTLVINQAGILFEDIHNAEIYAMNNFGFPINSNLYISQSENIHSKKISSRIHTDRQCSLIIQLQGSKRWQIWQPSIKLANWRQQRGKDADVHFEPPAHLNLSWAETIIDVVLSAGDILYIPRGYPHQVSYVDNDDESIHLTLGIETETLGLTLEHLLICMLGLNPRSKIDLSELILSLSNSDLLFDDFRRSIPFGFSYSGDKQQIYQRIGNLTRQIYMMAGGVDGRLNSVNLMNRAYDIFENGRKKIMYVYKNKRDVEGENMNEQQDNLNTIITQNVKKYFGKCYIDAQDVKFLFGF